MTPKKRYKLMSVRLSAGMTPLELVAARREEREFSRTAEEALGEASATGEWFGENETGLDKDGVFGPPTPRATSDERAPAGHVRPS